MHEIGTPYSPTIYHGVESGSRVDNCRWCKSHDLATKGWPSFINLNVNAFIQIQQ